ncbi:MAG: PstS family phosphate ABC transporter substrate-binding protein [Verrucomicrobia bacterium]|nr:PstS family phosphate ABC transporter substrate-binding protein [bacterium]NDA10041.1 PstS family phosphate ABC transporter substrate-binding protein [Verrucomicrobiota bacterium]NDA26034.1 PstS family phosphate ABC transporter substrate-binding protein [Verrucomicrobiota bacterium]NDD56811.1 PstS family phosphate ABC transporter substrate-binding protein [Verrucomicrobiota bacterium]NDD81338.1 PstS family phosphate ABC transporter substrate-binding protein [Verrucomicrobiota bacterium]
MTFTNRALAALLTGLVVSAPGHLRAGQVVKIDGSSTVFPITEAVAEEFQKSTGNKVTVGISGTGGGFKKFARGETDVQNASRPIKEEEIKAAKEGGVEYLELPIAYDALTVVVNSKNDWVDSVKVSELKKLWEPGAQGKITKWSQVREGWPDKEIKLYGAGSDSGTFDYFTEAINGKSKASRGDYTASEDDNVLVQGVEGDRHALGYMGYSYFDAHRKRLKALNIEWDEKGKPAVGPSEESVLNGTYNPLSRPLFIYVNLKSLEKPEVADFVKFYLENVERLTKEVHYIPLPGSAYQTVKGRVANRQKGTAFAGHGDVAVPISEILKRTPVP